MAGYVFTVGKTADLQTAMKKGVFGTEMNVHERWMSSHEGAIADFLSMKPGDHVYFFQNRKLYGIGKLVEVAGNRCVLKNYPTSDMLKVGEISQEEMILKNRKVRFICTFEPEPTFFEVGLDMDYVLSSDPIAFKMLRVLWKLSFIKLGDVEDKALFDVILRENDRLGNNNTTAASTKEYSNTRSILENITPDSYRLDLKNIIKEITDSSTGSIRHEMGLEAAVIDYLMKNDHPFGHWDYLSHQVIASPFKPIDYMDKMDIFGYRYINDYKTVSKYLIMELKKGKVGKSVIDQVMKYVDWINQEYAHGDYEMIEAVVIAKDFSKDVYWQYEEFGERRFTRNKPAESKVWSDLRLFKYEINEDQEIIFNEVIK